MRFQVGQKAGDYEFLAVVEASPTGVTYRVQNLLADRQELLKILSPDLQDDQEGVDRFLREAKIHARLHHPNIAAFFNATRVEGQLAMTSELVEGASLEQRIGGGSLPLEQAAKYFEQALSALSYAHHEGVVHRDIKPQYLIITPDDNVKITGFGLAKKPSDPQLTQPGIVMGSMHYMSPEQVKGSSEVDQRSDIYSLGVVLYEAVTGKKPFDSKSQFEVFLAHVNQEPEPPSSVRAEIPPALDRIILTAMAKQPASRYQTAEEFRGSLTSLHGVLSGATAEPPAAMLQPESPSAISEPQPAPPQAASPQAPIASVEPQPSAAAESSSHADLAETAGFPAAPTMPRERPGAALEEPTPGESAHPETAYHEPPRQPAEPRASATGQQAGMTEPQAGITEPQAGITEPLPQPPAQSGGPAPAETQGEAHLVDLAGAPARAAGQVADAPEYGSAQESAWESPPISEQGSPGDVSTGPSFSWADESSWSYDDPVPPASPSAAETGSGSVQYESPSAPPAHAEDPWPEGDSDEELKEVPLLLRPSGDPGAHPHASASPLRSREHEASAASWFGDQTFAGWTSKDVLAVGALTFVIVAAVFFALLTFLNR
jgi:serine/threonine-protein kinase